METTIIGYVGFWVLGLRVLGLRVQSLGNRIGFRGGSLEFEVQGVVQGPIN